MEKTITTVQEPSLQEIKAEARRLHESLRHLDYSLETCMLFAPLTYKINQLKKQKNAVILAHNYQRPEILFGIADFKGDSLALSKNAAETDAGIIVFCGVHFMAETAKVLSPEKKVLLPDLDAGCSLAESITPEDVKNMRKKYPDAAVVTYVNTSAAVKAEADVCCTSANALQVVESLPNKKVIFIPDKYMAKNLQKLTKKEIISWNGTCVVHEQFTPEQIKSYRKQYPDLKVLAHTECPVEVVDAADISGSTSTMSKFAKETDAKRLMLITECGMADMLQVEHPDKIFVTPCTICPYMKKIHLENVLKTLENESNEITIPQEIMERSKSAIEKMMEIN